MKLTNFAKYAWGTLGYNILVILWGAYVRATGSGAGCGSHWPLCNGVVVPRSVRIDTIIEFTHRISSGLSLLLVIILFIWGWRNYTKGNPVRLGISLSILFIVTEALVGAALVLFSWVAYNESVARVISISIHLLNTFLLLASLTLTAWWASGGKALNLRNRQKSLLTLILGLLGVLILGISGAITALGDTLFPSGTLIEGIQQDFVPTAHFLVRLRVWHPVIAILTGLYIIFISFTFGLSAQKAVIKKLSLTLGIIFSIQLVAGFTNLILLAPIWMQLIHLLLADLVWISLIILTATILEDSQSEVSI